MGYRSEWCLMIAGQAPAVEAFVDELAHLTGQVTTQAYDAAECARTISHHRMPDRDWPGPNGVETLAIWHHDTTKCYGSWDTVIHDLIEFAQELGLLAAYGRIGEDASDIEFINDAGLYVPYRFELVLDDVGTVRSTPQ